MADYVARLVEAARRTGTLLCLGLDPFPERVPGDGSARAMEAWLERLLGELAEADLVPAALKPNLACFEQYGSEGLAALERLLDRWRHLAPVILDAKRGDIGATSAAYARAVFDVWGADAVTVSPWMGRDSVEPFLERCPERGVYLLLRTSNPGSADLQGLTVEGEPLWHRLHRLLLAWRRPGLGAVVGATRPEELTGPAGDLPLLIPGVGAQGGSPAEVLAALAAAPGDPGRHRVNVSSGILYADTGPVEACRRFREALRR